MSSAVVVIGALRVKYAEKSSRQNFQLQNLKIVWSKLYNIKNSKTASSESTVITLNIGTPRPATVVVLNIKQFNFTFK